MKVLGDRRAHRLLDLLCAFYQFGLEFVLIHRASFQVFESTRKIFKIFAIQ